MARPASGRVDIVDRKDGLQTFWLRVTVDGRRQRVRLGTDRDGWTPARAQVELEEQIKAIKAGTWAPPDKAAPADDVDPVFRAYASSWLEDNMLEWRPRTVTDVKWRLESHLLPLIGDERLSAFDIPRVTTIKTSLLRESRRIVERRDSGIVDRDACNMALRPLSNESINKCMALLARILDDAVERGYLRDNPARRVKRLRYQRPRRPILERPEVHAMLEAADRLDRRAAGLTDKTMQVAELRREGLTYPQIAERLGIAMSTAHYRQARYEQAGHPVPFTRIWVRLLWAAGLRIDEACRVRRCDIDMVANRVLVGQAKTDAGVRRVQLTPDTLIDLRRYLDLAAELPATAPLLPTRRGTRQDRTNAAKRVIKPLIAETNIVLEQRGQPALREGVSAHALRKTYFTFLHEAGAPPRWIADQGGHVDPSTSADLHRIATSPRTRPAWRSIRPPTQQRERRHPPSRIAPPRAIRPAPEASMAGRCVCDASRRSPECLTRSARGDKAKPMTDPAHEQPPGDRAGPAAHPDPVVRFIVRIDRRFLNGEITVEERDALCDEHVEAVLTASRFELILRTAPPDAR